MLVRSTVSGYDVAWKDPGSGQYGVWSTDAGGNYLSSILAVVPGTNATLESLETTFHQDLNGDGVIGILGTTHTTTPATRTTSLTQSGPNFYLDNIATGT